MFRWKKFLIGGAAMAVFASAAFAGWSVLGDGALPLEPSSMVAKVDAARQRQPGRAAVSPALDGEHGCRAVRAPRQGHGRPPDF